MATRRDVKKSREYYFGEGKEFQNQQVAVIHAREKRDKMVEELGDKVDGFPQIAIWSNKVQVEIPIKWEEK